MPMVSPTRSAWPSMSMSASNAALSRSASASAVGRLRPGRRDDGEFVAADARQEGALACRFDAARHFAQQRIADRDGRTRR